MDTPSADAELLISIYWNEHKIMILIWICWIGNEVKDTYHACAILHCADKKIRLNWLQLVGQMDYAIAWTLTEWSLQVIVDLLTHNRMYICMCVLANAVISLACLAPNWYICRSEHAEAWRKGAIQLYNATFWVPKCWS